MEESVATEDSPATESVQTPDAEPHSDPQPLSEQVVESSGPFVGQWNKLVSTTNWEKGRIIAEWRAALVDGGATVTDYSDEAWSQLVGQVTGQHVGRLRRVHERFAARREQFEGLYWSHYQAALDWPDAEMWLEGACKEGWSVAKMRAARWEAVGAPDDARPDEGEVVHAEMDEDAYQALAEGSAPRSEAVTEPDDAKSQPGDPNHEETHRQTHAEESADESSGGALPTAEPGEPSQRVRPFEALADLPEDFAEAFEQMKLAILAHKLCQWEAIPRDDVLSALEALKAMALAPSEG